MSTARVASRVFVVLFVTVPVVSAEESVPVRVKSKRPVRIDAQRRTDFGVHPKPQMAALRSPENRSDSREPHSESELRGLLGVQKEVGPTLEGVGRTRVNRFVDLAGDHGMVGSVPSAELSSVILSTSPIQQNRLVVDAPPKLRRFSPAQRTAVAHVQNEATQDLIAKRVELPNRPLDNLDQALAALSTQASPDASSPTQPPLAALRSTAQQDGFGMLALDSIGNHLPATPPPEPNQLHAAATTPGLRDFLKTTPPVREAKFDKPTTTQTTPHSLPQLPPPTRQDLLVGERRNSDIPDVPMSLQTGAGNDAGLEVPENTVPKTKEKRGLLSGFFARPEKEAIETEAEPIKTPRRNRGLLGRFFK